MTTPIDELAGRKPRTEAGRNLLAQEGVLPLFIGVARQDGEPNVLLDFVLAIEEEAARSTPVPASNVSEPTPGTFGSGVTIDKAIDNLIASNVSEGLREARGLSAIHDHAWECRLEGHNAGGGPASGDSCDECDHNRELLRGALAHAPTAGLDEQVLADALDLHWKTSIGHYCDRSCASLLVEYARLTQPDATEEAGR